MNNILDSGWIANILSVSFTLAIFLLGVPTLFIQTYVPENLRKYYFQIKQAHKREFNFTTVGLLAIIFIFGNHGLKYILYRIFHNRSIYCYYDNQIVFKFDLSDAYILQYTVSIGFFLYFCIMIRKSFYNTLFRTENVKEQIISYVFNNAINDINHSFKSHIPHLKTITTSFADENEGVLVTEKLCNLVEEFLRENGNHYHGDETKILFQSVIQPFFLRQMEKDNNSAIEKILKVCNKIGVVYQTKQNLSSYDSEYITQIFLTKICLRLIENHEVSLVRSCIITIQQFNVFQAVYFKIYFTAWENKAYSIIIEEIANLSQVILYTPNHRDIEEIRYSLIAYLSFFYCENKTFKSLAIKWFERVEASNLSKDDFLSAREEYMTASKLDTASKIDTVIAELYPEV